MKVIAISGDKQFYRIGNAPSDAQWYGVGEEVQKFIGNVKRGDLVDIKYQQKDGKRVLNFIKVTGSQNDAPTSGTGPRSTATTEPRQPTEYQRPKTPEERADIRGQAVGHMVSRTIIGLGNSGLLTMENLEQIIDTLYEKYTGLVTKDEGNKE